MEAEWDGNRAEETVSLLFAEDQTIIRSDKEDIEYMMRKFMEEYRR